MFQSRNLPVYCCCFCWSCGKIIVWAGLLTTVIMSLINWSDLSSCFKRETIMLIFMLIYWICGPLIHYYIIDFYIITIIFGIVDDYNDEDLEYNPDCLYCGESSFLYLLNTSYTVLSWIYSIRFVLLVLLFIGLLIFFVYLFYKTPWRIGTSHGSSLQEQLAQHNGIEDVPDASDLPDDLEEIVYSLRQSGNIKGQSMCAICLTEYEDGEKILKIRRCNHYFHHVCIIQWLNENRVCPYCRGEIRNFLAHAWNRAVALSNREIIP